MPVVSDSGPLLSFGRADLLGLLEKVLKQIHIPDAVWDEVVVQGAGKPASNQIAQATWIKKETISDRSFLDQLSRRLHLGEVEAIALAKQLKLPLLIDEKVARHEATRLGIPFFGTLRVLRATKEQGLIREIKPMLDQMVLSGMHIDETLYSGFLAQNGEAKHLNIL